MFLFLHTDANPPSLDVSYRQKLKRKGGGEGCNSPQLDAELDVLKEQ